MTYGAFTLTLVESHHCPPDRFPGEITEPVVPPVKAGAYKCGEAWSILVEHASGASALLQGSAGYVAGSLAGRRADVAYLGVGQLGVQSEEYIRTYWAETVEAVGATARGADPLGRLLPPARPSRCGRCPTSATTSTSRCACSTSSPPRSGVSIHLPTVWRREDPWSQVG